MSRVLPDNGRFDLAAEPSWLLMNQSTEEVPRGASRGCGRQGVFVQGSGRAKGRAGGDQGAGPPRKDAQLTVLPLPACLEPNTQQQ